MKKIGLCTFYDDNFGTCLQSYALEQILFKCSDDVEIIRYIRDKNEKSSLLKRVTSKTPRQLYNALRLRKRGTLWKKAFNDFRNEKMFFSKEVYDKESDISMLADKYDVLVCGSDMLWSEEFYDDWKFYFLGFAPKKKSIACAPSFGKNEIFEEHKTLCGELINDIGYLSCREEAGVQMIFDKFGLKCPQVLDPTFLFSREEWNQNLSPNRLVQPKYILTYLFGGIHGDRKKNIEKLAKKTGYKIVHIPMTIDEFNRDAYREKMGPLEFVTLFRDAEYIFTDTFHGTIFSIIFGKQFWVLDRTDKSKWAKYSDRMTSTLKMFGLSNRYICNQKDIDVDEVIEFDNVNKIIDEKRKDSMNYLVSALKGCLDE